MNFYILLILITMAPCNHVCCELFAQDHTGDHVFKNGDCITVARPSNGKSFRCGKHGMKKVSVNGEIEQVSNPDAKAGLHHVRCCVKQYIICEGIQINAPKIDINGHPMYGADGKVERTLLVGNIHEITSGIMEWDYFSTETGDSNPVWNGEVFWIIYCSIKGYVVIPATSNWKFPELLPCCDPTAAKPMTFVLN